MQEGVVKIRKVKSVKMGLVEGWGLINKKTKHVLFT
jgi:hypothetical protein